MRGDSARVGAGAPASSAMWPATSASAALRPMSKFEGLYALIPPVPMNHFLNYLITGIRLYREQVRQAIAPLRCTSGNRDICCRIAVKATQITICILTGVAMIRVLTVFKSRCIHRHSRHFEQGGRVAQVQRLAGQLTHLIVPQETILCKEHIEIFRSAMKHRKDA